MTVAEDLEAIRQLTARPFPTLDQKDWAGYRAVFTVTESRWTAP